MTVIAVRDGILAADCGEVWGDAMRPVARKVFNTGKYLMSIAGSSEQVNEYFYWVTEIQDAHKNPTTFYKNQDKLSKVSDGCLVLLMNDLGHIWIVSGIHATRRDVAYDALGSGADYAVGAMHAGASAAESVDIACKYSMGCMGPVTYITFDNEVSDPDYGLTSYKEGDNQFTVVR